MMSRIRFWDKILLLLLLASTLLRVALVLRGGQFHWPDEMLYYVGYQLALAWKEGVFGQVFREQYLSIHRHIAYPLLAFPSAWIQVQVMSWKEKSFADTLQIPTLFFSLSSVLSILLVYLIALRSGATRGEARLAAFLLSVSVLWAIWSRHLLPYDVSLFFLLTALWVGLAPSPSGWRSLTVGLLLGLGFFTYYGFWSLVGLIGLVHLLWNDISIKSIKRGLGVAAGILTWFVVFSLLWGSVYSRKTFFDIMIRFSHSIIQGVFSEGWSLPFAFLWHGEHVLLLLWFVGALFAVLWLTQETGFQQKRILMWLLFTVGLYILFVVNSVVLHRFIVYGRLVRPIIPFMALLASAGLWGLKDRFATFRTSKATIVFVLFVVLIAAPNWRIPLQQRWRHDVIREALTEYGNMARSMSVTGPETQHSLLIDRVMGFPTPPSHPTRYMLVNVDYPYPVLGVKSTPEGKVLFRYPNPLSYLPYQYEGWTPDMRAILRSVDISMKLIDTQQK